MACYHPLKGFPVGVTPAGKTDYKITSYDVDHVYQIAKDSAWYCTKDVSPSPDQFRAVRDFIEIPCGRCIGCRLEHSRQWANRLMLESQSYHMSDDLSVNDVWFVTLTYDNEHLPINFFAEPSTGLAIQNSTLVKRDCQLFLKRLRKAVEPDRIRFYLCGEYGGQTERPHYHVILYGLRLPEDDLCVYKRSPRGDVYYNSKLLSRVWPFGYVVVGRVTWETCAYTSRYVTKKLTGAESDYYRAFNLLPPFSLMSRRPGIARNYYDSHSDSDLGHLSMDAQIVVAPGKFSSIPRYFESIIEREDPSYFEQHKEARKIMAQARKEMKLAGTDLDYMSMLASEESALLSRIQSLSRNKIGVDSHG